MSRTGHEVPFAPTSLREARAVAGLRVGELASAVGVTPGAISNMEAGRLPTSSLALLRRIAKATGLLFFEATGEWLTRGEYATRLRRSAAQLIAEAELLEREAA